MHNAVVVKILQGQDRFSKVHPCHFYRQWAHVLQQVGTISTLTKVETQLLFAVSSSVTKLLWLTDYINSIYTKYCTVIVNKVNVLIWKCITGLYLLHIPWPCRGDGVSQKNRTWRQQRGSQQRLGCPAPRMPAGSGFSGPSFGDLSFSLRTAGASPCGGPDTQPWQNITAECYP